VDANTYEALLRSAQDPPVSIPTQTCLPPSPPPGPSELPDVPDHPDRGVVANCETSDSDFIIDRFPGDAGTPITGPDSDSPLSHADSSHNIWAPFQSQCDWEVAHWAKMCGATSSAVDTLLTIPEVRISNELMFQST
jgi:hypothetical protein